MQFQRLSVLNVYKKNQHIIRQRSGRCFSDKHTATNIHAYVTSYLKKNPVKSAAEN